MDARCLLKIWTVFSLTSSVSRFSTLFLHVVLQSFNQTEGKWWLELIRRNMCIHTSTSQLRLEAVLKWNWIAIRRTNSFIFFDRCQFGWSLNDKEGSILLVCLNWADYLKPSRKEAEFFGSDTSFIVLRSIEMFLIYLKTFRKEFRNLELKKAMEMSVVVHEDCLEIF